MALAAPRELHPTTAYAVDVLDGRIVAGEEVRWAAQRHLDDLEHGDKRAGIWFDEQSADRIIRFFEQLRLIEGEAAGQPFRVQPWHAFVLGSAFGWMRQDGFRRFREVWVRVARGNTKSTMAAGVGLYGLGWDGAWNGPGGVWQKEQRAQVFAVATKLSQAAIVHGIAMKMVLGSSYLRSHLTVPKLQTERAVRVRILHPESASFFEPLGRDAKTEDGWAPLIAVLDEVHAYGSRDMWDVMESAMVKRRQPMIFAITTAGYGGAGSFGLLQDGFYRDVVNPKSRLVNDSAFVYIAQLTPTVRCAPCRGRGKRDGAEDGPPCKVCGGRGATGDDYRDEQVWEKANPNLGESVYVTGLRARVEKAQQDKRILPDVLVKNFNLWQQGGQKAISLDAWDASGATCPMPPESELRVRPCFAGLDLGSNRDLLALVLYWPACGPWKTHVVAPWFWVAEETVPVRLKEDRRDYRPWVDSGEIETTPGEFTDQDAVRRRANALARCYPVKKAGCDRKFGEKLLPELQQDGFEVVRIAQTFANLCPAWQVLERIIGRQELAHGDNAVMRWCAGNVVLAKDLDGLEMPSKGKSAEKIDGIAALLNAIYLAMITPYAGPAVQPVSHALSRNRGGGRRAILGAFK